MKIHKLLISLIFFLSLAACEPSHPPERGGHGEIDKSVGTVTHLEIDLVIYPSYEDIWEAFPDDDGELEGISFCNRGIADNIARCEIHFVEPWDIDGEHTMTLGHEVLHGVYGLYHDQENYDAEGNHE